ncbi:MAG: ABC transporter ATP-binding protein [Deltaproteobacteria bacterium]|nr:ABC transporter ATP-binding protein [Deltaproteobacteria bacterium]
MMDADDQIAIRTVGLHKAFGSNRVLRGISIDFPRGTTTVILGGSGSGKSVLMKHLIGLLRPDQGQILVEGEDLASLHGEKLTRFRTKFGMVFQWAALFDSMTVGDNVAFPLREHHPELSDAEIARRVSEKLSMFGLEGTEMKFPADLSGGMRKRVGLARAIILEPRIVLYDEPTTGLDPITTNYVDEMILRAKERLGVTSVVISHDIGSAFHIADFIAFLYEGEIVAYGPPRELRQSTHPFVSEFLSMWFGRN